MTEVVVRFDVEVTKNSASTDPLTINSLNDSVYNNITTYEHDGIQSTTCNELIDEVVSPGASRECCFTAVVETPHTNTVTVVVWDDENNSISPSGTATFTWY